MSDKEELGALIVAHDPEDMHPDDSLKCLCGETIGTSDGLIAVTDPYGHLIDQLLASDWLAKRDRRIKAEGVRAAAGFMARKSDEAKHFARNETVKYAGREFLARLSDKYADQAHELAAIAERMEAGE